MPLDPPTEPDFEAEIYALPTESGGRKSPMLSGYRPNHDFGLPGELNDAKHDYPETGKIAPGERGVARLWLLSPERQKGRLFEGMEFTVQEGNRVVGRGKIVKILKDELKRP
jgi:elongation factor Tu